MSRASKIKYTCLFLFVCIVAGTKFYFGKHINVADDVWFANVHNSEPNIFSWLKGRYFQWTSRVPIEFLLVTFITHFKIWVVINSIMFSLLIVSILKFLKLKEKKLFFATIVMFFLILWGIPKNVFFEAVIWMTGSFNYLWPVATAAVALLLLYENYEKKRCSIYCLASSFLLMLSSFNEQMAVVNIVAIFTAMVYLKLFLKKKVSYLVSPFISVAVVVIFISTCPGNMSRYHLEILSWFKGFGSIGLFGKFILGCNLYVDSLISERSILPFLSSIVLIILCKKNWAKSIALFWTTVALFLLVLHPEPVHLDEYSVLTIKPILKSIVVILYLISMILIVFLSRPFDQISLIAIVCFITSSLSVIFLGMSPTIYASGKRILFISYVIMIFFIMVGFFKKDFNIIDESV